MQYKNGCRDTDQTMTNRGILMLECRPSDGLLLGRRNLKTATSIWRLGIAKDFRTNQTGSSIDDVISAVDVDGVASDEPGRIMSQERGCGANVFDADQAARRRFGLRFFK